jgi:hypothetical protein
LFQVQLLIYFMLKYAMEILLSESSVVSSYYFGWNTSTIAVFLATLGLTVLPVNAVVGTYVSNMFEDRQILLASEVLLLAGILLSFHVAGTAYGVAQYVCSALLTFVSAEVLEGCRRRCRRGCRAARTTAGCCPRRPARWRASWPTAPSRWPGSWARARCSSASRPSPPPCPPTPPSSTNKS